MYPLYPLPLAVNRVKTPGLVTLVVGVGNVALALFLAGPAGWGLYGIAAAGAITLTVRHLLFTPLYSAYILNQPWTTFYKGVPVFVLATLLITGLCRATLWLWPISNWLELILGGIGMSLVFLIIAYLLLAPSERAELKESIKNRGKAAPATA
jgi:membrane protein EpsK